LYDREDVDWDGQYSSGRKRRPDHEGVAIDMDYYTRKLRKPRIETQEEINQRLLSIEMAVKEALSARGERQFTDQEFPPNDRSLYVDPANPPQKLQASFMECSCNVNIIFCPLMFVYYLRLYLSG